MRPALDTLHWRGMLNACITAQALLNDRERGFVRSLQTWHGPPTPRQFKWLRDIFRRVTR